MKRMWSTPAILIIILIFVCGTGWLLVLDTVKSIPLLIYVIIQGGLIVRIAKLIADLEHPKEAKK